MSYPFGLRYVITLCLRDKTTVGGGAEIVLFRPKVSLGASLGDLILAPMGPIEKVTLWTGLLYSTLPSEIGEGVAKDKVSARTGNRTRYPWSMAQYAIHYAIAEIVDNSVN